MVDTHPYKTKLFLLLVIALSISLCTISVSGITSISPTEGHQSINQQPIISWTTSVIPNLESYTLTISSQPDVSNPVIVKTQTPISYQVPSPLTTGIWYWRIEAKGKNAANETVNEISNIFSFQIIDIPHYTVVPDLSHYDEEKRVTFVMDAPLGSEVHITISKVGFTLPFISSSLASQTFVSFLDPGSYTIDAEFTHNGMTSTYSNSFTVDQYVTPIYTLNFNISDQDDKVLSGVKIRIEDTSGTFNKTITTNNKGWASITLEEGRYNILIEKEGYYDKDLSKKSITKDTNFTYKIFEENYFLTTDTSPNVQATSIVTLPEVTLVLPTYKQEVKEELTAVFAVSNHAYASNCELLFKTEEQKGWNILASLDKINSTGNSITGKVNTYGPAQIKVRCHAKHSNTIKDSAVRSIVVLMPPKNHDGIQQFLSQLDEAKKSISSSSDPLYKNLAITDKISKARQDLLNLDEQYLELTGEGKIGEAEALSKVIEQKIATQKKELIVGFKITKTSDVTLTSNTEALSKLISIYLADEEEQGKMFMMEEKQKEAIREEILAAQNNYFIRSKSSVAELTKADGSKEYITGLTRTIQNLEGGQAVVVVGEKINTYLLQQAGKISILTGDEESNTLQASTPELFFSVNEGEPYTLSFQGDLSELLAMENTLVIIPSLNYSDYRENGKVFNSITGKAISAISGEGGVFSILLWALIGIALIGFVFSPLITKKSAKGKQKSLPSEQKSTSNFQQVQQVQTEYATEASSGNTPALFSGNRKQEAGTSKSKRSQNKIGFFSAGKTAKKVRVITDSVHDILDLIELGNHQEAFVHFPRIISLYEELPLPAQEELSFAIQLLTAELDAYDLQQHVGMAMQHIENLEAGQDISHIIDHTNTMIASYQQLNEHARNRVKPHVEAYQQKLQEKHEEFSRQK